MKFILSNSVFVNQKTIDDMEVYSFTATFVKKKRAVKYLGMRRASYTA